MPIPIDPPRRVPAARSAKKPEDRAEDSRTVDASNLPVPVSAPRTIPAGAPRVGGDAAIHAQVIGEKRGLRAGPSIHDEAKSTYNKTHWSGSNDRRRPKGRTTKTEV
jgi:hypothetical protein